MCKRARKGGQRRDTQAAEAARAREPAPPPPTCASRAPVRRKSRRKSAPRGASALKPAKHSVLTTATPSPGLEASAMPTMGPLPRLVATPSPDPSGFGPMDSPHWTGPSTRIGTCPRKAHQCPRPSSSAVGIGSPFHFALLSETTK